MAQKSISCVLIICFDSKRFQHIPNCTDDFLTDLILDHALFYRNNLMCFRFGFHRNHFMGSLLINTGDDLAISFSGKYCMNFISIIKGIIHSNDWFYICKLSKKLLHPFLLGGKLFFIRNTLILAASAFL